ncbi:putative bifunctional diguanylate cyclase/phosphodiesterase [endosymbiont of unidentified scaly snail isolate Monju]|uniref:putative bifunctional diguanylate cyclase/phosphodiesterase n=1 Tax=endosymbiont of unidentified scaly snail isolate Monju TaxID=1248727 RepID=UPI00038928F3|nr:EAL domain-containing protein [endosymbiont of unidentified scaly snail isolate Monju]BAN69725.1 signal transduction protein [endosymbiont of unidentified scaly snail isolate Monju]
MLRSFKVRIVVTILLLELVMLSLVLGFTQTSAFERTREQIAAQDDIILDLLGEAGLTALPTREFSELAPLFRQAATNPHIQQILLLDDRQQVIAASDPQLIGQHLEERPTPPDTYLRAREIRSGPHSLGKILVTFSNRELEAAYASTLSLGIGIALIGTTTVAIAGLLLGLFLTRRLQRIIDQTRRFASGDLQARVHIDGDDELAELGNAFNQMATQISGSLRHIQHLAYHDSLTGLANRMVFHQRLRKAVNSALRSDHQHVLMYLDLDQFKIINDTCGHDAGDTLLIEITRVIASQLRARDTIARLGGDEFGILLENCNTDQARAVAEKILHAVREYRFDWNGHGFRIGVSIGVVPIGHHTPDMEKILSLADMACYAAKDKGRNTIHLVSEQDNEMSRRSRQMQWMARLQEGMERHLFVVHCQWIANTNDTQRRPFAEFLLRLVGSNEELILPDDFIPAAESFHLMPALDRHTIELVFKALAELAPEHRPQMAFINLSGQSLADERLSRFIEDRLLAWQLPPSAFCFEITETVAVANLEQADGFIARIQALGASVALDDFGSGMSSFVYLKHLRADFVKIDGGFVHNIVASELDRHIVAAIDRVAHHAGFRTIAESVEDRATLEILRELGVDYVQGHAIDRPRPVEQTLGPRPPHLSPQPASPPA